jgi:hypothetical protein
MRMPVVRLKQGLRCFYMALKKPFRSVVAGFYKDRIFYFPPAGGDFCGFLRKP